MRWSNPSSSWRRSTWSRSPVMAVVMLGTILSALIAIFGAGNTAFAWSVTIILLVTVLFANFAEAVAEARGRGQAASLRPRAGPDRAQGSMPASATRARSPRRSCAPATGHRLARAS